MFLAEGSALYDHLGSWFTLLRFGDADPSSLIDSALAIVNVAEPSIARIYGMKLVLVRPDTHVAWRGDACDGGDAVSAKALDRKLA